MTVGDGGGGGGVGEEMKKSPEIPIFLLSFCLWLSQASLITFPNTYQQRRLHERGLCTPCTGDAREREWLLGLGGGMKDVDIENTNEQLQRKNSEFSTSIPRI